MTTRKQSVSCGMSAADLQAAFDGGAGITAVMQHVTKCRACARTLRAFEVQREAVESLMMSGAASAGSFGAATRGASATAVQGMLAHSARAGRTKMADLVYELAKACLIALPDLERRVRRIEEPRAVPQVSKDVQALNLRLPAFEKSADVSALPRLKPAETAALDAARSCLKILEHLEGSSPRQVLATSHWLIFSGKPAKATEMLRLLFEDPGLNTAMRRYVVTNLTFALMWDGKVDEALEIADRGLAESPDDERLLFNAAVACARTGNQTKLRHLGSRVGKLLARDPNSPLRQLIEFEIPRLADCLRMSHEQIEKLFGMPKLGVS